jgi:HEAT repeat protein
LAAEGGPRLRLAAIRALGALGPAASAALPTLKALVKLRPAHEPAGEVEEAAAGALARIGGEGLYHIVALVQEYGRTREGRRPDELLAALGQGGAVALPTLLEILEKPDAADPAYLHRAACALGGMGPAGGDAVARLRALFATRDPRRAPAAAVALLLLRPAEVQQDEALPFLTHHLGDGGEAPTPDLCAEALVLIGGKAVPKVAQALAAESVSQRRAAAEVLGRIGAPAASAVPRLAGLLTDIHPYARRAAAEALGALGPPAQGAVEALRAARNDDDEAVRRAADRALQSITAPPREGTTPRPKPATPATARPPRTAAGPPGEF